jgi:hypothetical protein
MAFTFMFTARLTFGYTDFPTSFSTMRHFSWVEALAECSGKRICGCRAQQQKVYIRVAQLGTAPSSFRYFPPFVQPKTLLPRLKNPATGFYHELHEFSPHSTHCIFNVYINIILLLTFASARWLKTETELSGLRAVDKTFGGSR